MQSTVGQQDGDLQDKDLQDDLHVAVIMDGNGRWATRRGLPRSAGHRAGVLAARRVVEAAPDLSIATLTLFAFSSDNWRRPRAEVSALMSLLRQYLKSELHRLVDALPDESLPAAAILLRRAQDPVIAKLDAAPLDDEDLTDEDRRAIKESREEPGTPWSEVEAELNAG